MKISVLSDFHFGYGYNTELEEDSFENAEEAMTSALDSDLIIVAGDIFDTKFPRTPVWSKAIKILTKPIVSENGGINFVKCSKDLKKISSRVLLNKPIVALHGNHEFRGKTTNTLEALDNAGILIHLHKDTIIFEKNGTRVAIHGMSWVPDRYAKSELDEWGPIPIEGCVNILVLHQSISPFLYSPLEKPSIDADNLPEGFDLIVDGHLHGAGQEKVKGTPLIFPGSTVITQFDKTESRSEKGFYVVEINERDSGIDLNFKFNSISCSRKFFFEDVNIGGGMRLNIEKKIDDILSLNHKKRPLIKLKLRGDEKDYIEHDLKEIEKIYGKRAILKFVKELESPEIAEKVEFLRNMRERKLSSEEIGLNLLNTNLEEMGFQNTFRVDNVFSLLVEGRVEEVLNLITGEQKILGGYIDNET